MIIFRYKKEIGRNNIVIRRPVADVFLRAKNGNWIEFHPYIDSGADVTLIPLSLGKLLGLDATKGEIERIGGISGSIPVVYLPVRIRIGTVELPIKLGWALVERVPPLLGRDGVFDRFEITFRQRVGEILFNPR